MLFDGNLSEQRIEDLESIVSGLQSNLSAKTVVGIHEGFTATFSPALVPISYITATTDLKLNVDGTITILVSKRLTIEATFSQQSHSSNTVSGMRIFKNGVQAASFSGSQVFMFPVAANVGDTFGIWVDWVVSQPIGSLIVKFNLM